MRPMPGQGPPVLLAVDVMPLCYQSFYALPPITNPAGEPVNAVLGVLNAALKLLREHAPAAAAFALDPKGPTIRHREFPEYKAQRKPMPDLLRPQIDRVAEGLRALGLPVLVAPGFEADDVLATLAVLGAAGGWEVRLAATDKDLLQLLGPGVSLVHPKTGERTDEARLLAQWGLAPRQVPDYLALAGDASDNLPGVPGVGPKTAAAWLAAHGDLEGVVRAGASLMPPRAREALARHADQARRVRALATLQTGVELKTDIGALRPRAPQNPEARRFLEREGLKALLARIFGGQTALPLPGGEA